MMLLTTFDYSLPLENPVLKFLLILTIILFTPIILNRIKIPHILGLIIAGAIIGPHGIYLIERDSGIILSGTAGLLYIMFLAGLEIDMLDFKKNIGKGIFFGLLTFSIPMALGTYAGLYLLKLPFLTSLLLASLFASHTLIAYPIVSKFGIVKNKAVVTAVGGTMITDTLALLVLAVVVGMSKGEVNEEFWIRLSVSIVVFAAIILLLFPLLTRWFFKQFEDSVSQYIFVLVMVFSGSVLAEMAGIEAIIGAFLSGLALNRLIPHTSPLMNRIDFVGNAIFIPFFLIGVGMLIDFRVFVNDIETIWVAFVMTVIAISSKFIAAWFTQKTFRFSADQRRVLFGLSSAQAAATLAAVIVGYNIIIGYTDTGEPIRLLGTTILNGSILMILITCTTASFATQKGVKNIVLAESQEVSPEEKEDSHEKILIPISNFNTVEELVNLSVTIKSNRSKTSLFALNIIDEEALEPASEKNGKKILNKAAVAAAATDNHLHELLRFDVNIVNGIYNVVKERKITDLVLGASPSGITDSFVAKLNEGILAKCNITTLIYRMAQPLSTIKRHIVIVPENAEKEIGFPFWLIKMWNIARNTGAKLVFYGSSTTLSYIKEIHKNHPIESAFYEFSEWDDFLILSRDIHLNDCINIVLSRQNKVSYHQKMTIIPTYLNKYFSENSYTLIYPIQAGVGEPASMNINNPSMLEPIAKLDEFSKSIASLFKRK